VRQSKAAQHFRCVWGAAWTYTAQKIKQMASL